ncbi:unnamed protein product [Phytophthora fragariaefolia]|uniref:Unnamed protein product n=1 Tax=Phytophthora fragariaefolia TaxID=1490495 RepID=A0A9W6Y6B8_9STRA|nr:unnamed protein product [Phytophthora fragariaefolia]
MFLLVAFHDLSDGYLYTPVQDADIAASAVQIQHASSLGWTSNLKEGFSKAYCTDPGFRDKYRSPHDPYLLKDRLLYVQFMDHKEDKVMILCVPRSQRNRLGTKIIEKFHDFSIAAHPGIRQVVSVDFVTGLPVSDGYDAFMTVVDKLSKRPIYCPVHTIDDAEEIDHCFFDNVVRHHGVPAVIISDRDPKFTSRFWTSLVQSMCVQLNMATSYCAQADGQTEHQNLIVEAALRCMVSCHGDEWAAKRGTIEYAHPTLVSATTGLSPFEVDTGRKERNPFATFPTLSTTAQVQQGLSDNVQFNEGFGMLDTRRIPLKHAAKDIDVKRAKLAARKVGPLVIMRMINGTAARLICHAV